MKTIYQDYQVTLTAGEFRNFQCHGRYLTILENSLTTDMMVSFDGQSEQPIPKGFSVEIPENENFITIGFRNLSGSSATIRFCISNGKVYDNRNVITGTVSVDDVANTVVTPVAITVPTTAPGAPTIVSDSTVKERWVLNSGANPVWWGDVNVDGAALRGQKIDAAQTGIVPCNGDIYFRATGGSTTISIANLKKV